MHSQQIQTKAVNLERFWAPRNKKFKEWYEQIRMVDLLAQRDMESFVGNDPRASFNLIASLLNQTIPHRLPPDQIAPEQVAPAAELSFMFETIWRNVFDHYRLRGRKFLDELIKFLLITGWYSVFVSPSLDGSSVIGEVWNPATVYPMWDDKLTEVAHIFSPGANAVDRMAMRNGWSLKFTPTNTSVIWDYWWLEKQLFGKDLVHNAILVNQQLVKDDTVEMRYDRIPIFISPVGGLPDTGPLATRTQTDLWKQEVGQSFLATNEHVHKASNKWWTYLFQLMRDTAEPRTFERTSSPNKIVTPENWYRRGAHYKIGQNDEIGYITPPPIPVELRSAQLDLEAMEQRGGPNHAMFGALQQRMTAFGMSQVAASTNQVSRAYHEGVVDCFTDMDNFLYTIYRERKYKPYGLSLPSNLPKDAKLTAAYELRIPGDLVQKATVARMLNPDFELSDDYIIEHLFPEIKSPAVELARVRASKARTHPLFGQLSLIEALQLESAMLREASDIDGAELYDKAAARLEQSIVGEEQQPPQQQPAQVRVRPEVRPPQTTESAQRGTQ